MSAPVTRIHPNRFAPQPRPCSAEGCTAEHFEVGELCESCREAQDPIPAAMAQATIADGICRLEKLKPGDVPERLKVVLAMVMSDLRRAFDAVDTLVQEER